MRLARPTAWDAVNVSQLKSSGLVGEDGKSRAAVTYDKNADGTPNFKSATLAGVGGTTLSNVADGKADKDAVNVSQLKSSGLVGEDGKSRAAVTYDKNADGTPNYNSVTLGGGKSTGPVTLSNVAEGKAGTDAVNVDQLTKAIGDLEGGKNPLGVAYDTASKDKVTLAGKTGTTLSNVAAGKADTDAVNVSQLKSSGLVDKDGKSIAAVTYDKNADGTPNFKSVTLAGDGGTKLTNVKAAELSATSTDAVNGSQLFATNENLGNLKDTLTDGGVIDKKTGESLAVVYDSTSKDKVTLAGKTGTTLSNVKAGMADHDAVNVSQLKSSGLIGEDGKSLAAVTYDKKADGTPNYNTVTLGGGKSTGPVTLSNVAKGQAGTDAVNVDQLKDIFNGDIDFKYIKVKSTGVAAIANGKESVAIGSKAVASKPYTLALGSGARVTGSNSVAIGVNSVADEDFVVSVGDVGGANGPLTRRIVNVSDGIDDQDAVTMKQLTEAMHSANTELDQKMTRMTRDVSSKPGTFVAIEGMGADGSMPNVASIEGGDPTLGTAAAIGVGSVAAGLDTVAIGLQTAAMSNGAVALGSFAQTGVDHPFSVAIGSSVTTNGAGALAIGSRAKANADNAMAVGNNGVMALGKSSIAMGDKAVTAIGSTNSVALGKSATVAQNVTDAMALGANASVASGNSGGIALGANSIADRANALSIGTTGTERQIVHVAKGTQNTDAVNLSQLKGLADVVGGGTGFDANGDVTAPTYTIDGKDYASVGDAIKALEQREGGTGNGANPNAVVYDNSTKAAVTLAGANGTVLRNVAEGSLGENSTEAVNGRQVNFLAQSIADSLGGGAKFDPVTGDIAAPTYELTAADGLTDTYDNVGDAFKHIDERVSTHTTQIDTLQKGVANAVQYDDATHASVTLGGAGAAPVMLKNVADGVDETDAVNVRQLRSAGLVGEDGKLQSAVVYDKNADGTTNYGSVTLGGAGATAPVALHNVAAGKVATDAVNVSQLSGVTDALGGGAKIDEETGKVVAPTYNVGGDSFHNAGDALNNIDNRVTQIQNNLGETTKLVGAVAYDKNADGTVNFNKVTLGNGLSSGPVVLTNVADGKSQYDAVNYGQFSKLEGRVNDIDDRLTVATTPNDGNGNNGNNGNSGANGSDLIHGTGGSGKDSAEVVAAKPGNGNGNIAVGSGSQIVDGKNNGTAIGAGSKVSADDSTALGHGATVSSGATNSVALGSGSKATEAHTVSIGSEGHERRLVNVADAVNKMDAVNKGQLDRAIGGMQGQINDMSRNAYSGIAAATALTMIPGVDPGKTLSFGVAGASYKGYQAVAMGGEARITENLKMRAGVGLSSGGNTFGVGASYQW
ncbi:YadA family autotransporter adhesin [Burkholderia lata]|uniref:YadA family autotransporter adhesin n=1 Tax=Burkholderia lata (strain ATCC 17760 / DSM 23089 / LMG 22485 / NCIMB 9086 / R18194 / 383) TaxID=482957 RepID=UPI00399B7AF3